MIDVKVYYLLAIVVLSLYATLAVLNQFEWFKKYKDEGATFAFEAVLAMVALFVGFTGIWFNGYQEGLKNGRSNNRVYPSV